MSQKNLNPDARNLEDAFFARENAKLLDRLRRQAEADARRAALREAVGIDDEELLDRLFELGIGAETALALRLVPLVFVAWADGSIDDRERDAIHRAADDHGISKIEHASELLRGWLASKPDGDLLDLWRHSIRHVMKSLDDRERAEMKKFLVDSARRVAEAAGGFLGITSKISAAEAAVLEDLEKAFD